MALDAATVELLICTRCQRTGEVSDGDVRPGKVLCDALAAAPTPGIAVVPVACLSNCSRGCTIALRGPDRWTYVYGGLNAGDVDTIRDGAARYRDSADGLVPWRERPEHFRKNCIARIPPLGQAGTPIPSLKAD
ncbi:Predicted metal-binding protein [Loktanella fryxellensis]|uniref:Predicted metal-binding protein n=1 Tax=Loktanella fryxellensis TaxID=245187 RepID=A0A1H8C8U3_9RHOB|nr:DUF1636 domain-containing protein [Loktanella fryxellensis]SEM91392.1 Predicted metal-binding protein [Loktanella fryxellensis]